MLYLLIDIMFDCSYIKRSLSSDNQPSEIRADRRGGATGRRGAHDDIALRHHYRDHGADLQRTPHHRHSGRREVGR